MFLKIVCCPQFENGFQYLFLVVCKRLEIGQRFSIQRYILRIPTLSDLRSFVSHAPESLLVS